ncbi:polyisoprenoid-binding protein YceI [Chiayiivirga flava]|uniref:Polyisoprenoid-binding protein YceI n=2 Tax=Chiayiivirga flava TaxID=659595 RepID=A0A7W8D893_9GAMM|nr:polyisoprenoid-binding protein YceI [Chiayiivirga flava]
MALPCLLAAAGAFAKPQHYELDPVHTRIVFAIDHLGFSKSLGTFSHPSGSLWFDPDDWRSARVDVTVDIASLDLGDAKWRERMFKRDYFDLDDHAQARFVSTAVEPTGDTTARVHGNLTLRGTTLPLSLDVTLNRHGRNPLTLRTTAGFSATATLKRSDFGMDDNLRTVGDAVELRIEVEASRKRATRDESDDNPATSSPHTATEPA